MSNFPTITEYSFKVGPHHLRTTFASILNNMYVEQFDNAITTSFFTDTAQTAVAEDIITKIRNGIIDAIEINSQTDLLNIAPIINSMFLYAICGKLTRRIPFRTPSSMTSALVAAVAAGETTVIITLNSASFHVASNGYNHMDFAGISTTVIVPPTAAAAVAAAALQATASQTTAAIATAAVITATLPTVFDARNLPADVRDRYNTLHHPTDIVTKSAMVPLDSPAGACGSVLSYLDPSIGAGKKPLSTDAN